MVKFEAFGEHDFTEITKICVKKATTDPVGSRKYTTIVSWNECGSNERKLEQKGTHLEKYSSWDALLVQLLHSTPGPCWYELQSHRLETGKGNTKRKRLHVLFRTSRQNVVPNTFADERELSLRRDTTSSLPST